MVSSVGLITGKGVHVVQTIANRYLCILVGGPHVRILHITPFRGTIDVDHYVGRYMMCC